MNLRQLWHKARDTDLARHGLVLFVALTFAGISNLLFHFVMGRLLGPAAYGALGALLSVFTVVSVVTSAVQAVVAKRISILRARGDDREAGAALKSSLRAATFVAVATAGVLAACAPLLQDFLKLDSAAPALMLAAFVFLSVITPVIRGALQGRMLFSMLAGLAVGGTVVRLIAGIAFVTAGGGVTGAVAASVIAEVAALVVGLLPLRDLFIAAKGAWRAEGLFREAVMAMVAFGGFLAIWNLDTTLARHFFSREVSGYYAAGAVVAHIVFFLPGAVAMVAFPRFAESEGRSVEARRTLFHSIVAVTVLGFGAAAFFSITAKVLVRLLYGSQFVAGASVVGVLSLAMAFLGVLQILIYFHLASNSKALFSLIPAVAIEIAGIALFHDSITQVSLVVLVVSAGLLIFNVIAAYAQPGDPRVQPVREGELWAAKPTLDISVVTPAFNPGATLGTNLGKLFDALREGGLSFEVIAVSDGSTDGSHLDHQQFGADFTLVHYDINRGKGFALRTGLARARGSYVAFIDSDMDLNPSGLPAFVELLKEHDVDIVVGSKRHPESRVFYPPMRRLMSWTYHKLVRLLFGIGVRDTQTGLKVAKREVLAEALPRMLEKRFAFDLELLVVARLLGYRKILEAPVELQYQFQSTVSWRTTVAITIDTLAIFYRRYILRYYHHAPGEVETHEVPVDLPVEIVEIH